MNLKAMIIPIIIIVLFVILGVIAGIIVSNKSKPGSDVSDSKSAAPVNKVNEKASTNDDNGIVAGAETSATDSEGVQPVGGNVHNSADGITSEPKVSTNTIPTANTDSSVDDYSGFGGINGNQNSQKGGNVKTSVTVVDDDYYGFAN